MTRWSAPASPDGQSGAGSVFGPRQRWLLLLGFGLLVALRLPLAWVHGRFLDEEATVFLAYAWHRPWLDALVRPFAGYWNLAANATTLVIVALVRGGALSMELAPYLTMIVALAAQLLPAALILTGRAGWLSDRRAVVAALLVIAAMPGTEEVFLNVLHIQFHLALCAALILALDPPRTCRVRVAYGAMLLVAPLCGPAAIVILPLFALRALIDRDRVRATQAAVFALGATAQLLLFYGASPMRGHLVDPGTLAAILVIRLVVLPLFGLKAALGVGEVVYKSWYVGGWGWWIAAVCGAALMIMLVSVSLRRRDAAPWLALSALAIAAVSFGYGMVVSNPVGLFYAQAGERYNFLPVVLIGLALIVLATRPAGKRGPRSIVTTVALLVPLSTAVVGFVRPAADFATGPSWPSEVAAWRRDHRHLLAVWPRPWTADLSDTNRSCSPVGSDPARSIDPRYCESGWVAGFYRPPRPSGRERTRPRLGSHQTRSRSP